MTKTSTLLIAAMLVIMYGTHPSLSFKDNEPQSSFVPPPVSMKLVTLGFDLFFADLYWLAFVQYIGDQSGLKKDRSLKTRQYLELITSLDPTFVQAYYFAAIVLSGELNEPNSATQIIDFGVANNPKDWTIPFIAGVNQYLYAHNEQLAGKYYEKASKLLGAPPWLSRQARILKAKIPSTIKEINIWDSIYNNASDSAVKERARVKLSALWTQVYKTSPSSEIKNRALTQLSKLGENIPNPASVTP